MADAAAAPPDNSDALVQSLLQKFGSPPSLPNIIPFQQAKEKIQSQRDALQPPPPPMLETPPSSPPPAQITDALSAFTPDMMALAALGGALGGGITSMVQNATGFINGIHQGDAEATKNAHDEFNQHLESVVKKNQTAVDAYKAAHDKYQDDSGKLMDEWNGIANQENDEVIRYKLAAGQFDEVYKIIDARQRLGEQLRDKNDKLNADIFGTKPMTVSVTGADGKVTTRTVTYGRGGWFDASSKEPITGTVNIPSEQYGKNPKGAAFSKWMEEHASDNNGAGPTAAEQSAFIQSQSGTGGRQSVYDNRIILSGNEAAKDLANVVQLPTTASTGWFGGRTQGPGLLDATREVMANKMTSQEAQAYNVMSAGFQRSLAAIEAAGLSPRGGLTSQMDAVIFKEGDTNLTKLYKLAQTRQIVEAGLEVMKADPTIAPPVKEKVDGILSSIRQSVPFTASDLIKLQSAQEKNPKVTLSQIMPKQYKAGDIIDHGGKKYRVTGGDPSDPDVEPVEQ